MTHGLATQIKDKRLATVAEHELDSTILSEKFDYIALGHYHRQCQITDNAWYSGSTEFLTYGEIKDEKGGLIVDTAKARGPAPGPAEDADGGSRDDQMRGRAPRGYHGRDHCPGEQKHACRSTRWRR